MEEKTEKLLTNILYTTLAIISVIIFFQNIMKPWVIMLFCGAFILSVTIRNAAIYPSVKYGFLGKLTIFIDILLVFIINRLDKGNASNMLYFIIIGDSVISLSSAISISVSVISYGAYIFNNYIHGASIASGSLMGSPILEALPFVAVYGILFTTKYEISQRNKLNNAMHELKVKSRLLENTNLKLKEAGAELEELTILKERNRIAREIHDTVGHTLTTVLLEMEAGERLIASKPELAKEKIGLAKGQVRKGLNDIRQSVRTLQSGKEIIGFEQSLKLLIDDTTKHGDIFIRYDIKELPKLSEQMEKMLYRALQEGLTNGMRHGSSTAFVFQLKCQDSFIKFTLNDNGKGTDKIEQGFGLTAMEERVKELGGILNFSSSPDEGFSINITVPIGKENMYELS